ncbi:high affinity cGMP-specific 3',5'-cyclic phosphodiesterase 9A-like [Hippoglossus hippoglossus]|uniref:high affinity cGMP-specific 3',5'-cyclic phosphodiesterase 9A-like n=1 Tax=Hippoglossus hippoglossus TaxID=8267 RepID=UPI00148D4A1A|nr:high affinity cGMP-specific 3',5'-cyclic phosphodiesterase 9A-like [Hippoglossus hippoglossus]XP_034466749.1 high affinity cGMP-specific 3',5'-cyclic phosphodiesterase 9A-like [Hippoglossus hippoglossus]
MTTKIIHFKVNGKLETAEFGSDVSAADVKDLFRAAAEAEPHHILKMYNREGTVVKISPRLEANSRESYYRLEVVASDLQGVATASDLDNMEHRLHHLESRVLQDVGTTPDIMSELKSHVESFRRKLESVEHLSWIGLFKDDGDQHLAKSPPKPRTPQLNVQEERQQVRRKFLNISSLQVTEEVRELLKTPIFDNWQWEEAEMLVLLQVMFTNLDFLTAFHIELEVLQNFLFEVYCHYNNIPFHNFQHCFCVTQMMYGLIWLTDLRNKLGRTDLFIMLTSALCHDLDHPGYNNVYQINAQTDLALRYNDISPLENHHCAVAFGILAKPECNILKNLSSEQYKHIRGGMIKCILATDMAQHNEILNRFRSIQSAFDFSNKEHKEVLMKIMVKVSDISNEARPMAVAAPWLDCLLQEFFNQSDREKQKGLPVSPFMDRDKVSKPSSQTSFIRFVLLPLFSELSKLFPCLEQHILEPVGRALEYYSVMEKASRDEEATTKP